MRDYLREKTELHLKEITTGDSKVFTVVAPIGKGANSMVYDAVEITAIGTKKYRIKECFPDSDSVSRNDSRIIWNDEDEKNITLSRFLEVQKLISKLQANEQVGNTVVGTVAVFEGNGTLYSVMDVTYGNVYSKDNCTDLKKIVETMLVISRIIKEYHDLGFLHLDIKPDNFMVCYTPNIWVWLFDFDTITPIGNIESGKISSIPYSPGWGAPEQRLNAASMIGRHTDIYSIGSILFLKTMGRKVSADDIGPFADWSFDNDLFRNVNPKVIRLLNTVFTKTLAANTKKRYQTVDELIKILEEIDVVLSAGKPYILSKFKPLTTPFLGRENELSKIRDLLCSEKRAVFICGDGGIGKSSLAIKYGEKYKKQYDNILFLRYRGSLENLVDDVIVRQLCNFDSEDKDEKRMAVSRIIDRYSLIIVDNFDVEVDQDDYLDEFLEYDAHIIFTTRTDFKSVLAGEIAQVDVKPLFDTELMQLFELSSGLQIKENDISTFLELVKSVEGNTFAIELYAKQVAASGYDIGTILSMVQSGIKSFRNTAKVKSQKDGRISKTRVYDSICSLFNLANLSEERRQCLRNMYILRFLHVYKETYLKYTYGNNQDIDTLNDLVELGWIKTEYGINFYLHPLIEELIANELKPDEKNCSKVYYYINEVVQSFVEYEYDGALTTYRQEKDFEFLGLFFTLADYSIRINLDLVIEWLTAIFENEDIDCIDSYYLELVFNALNTYLKNNIISEVDVCAIQYYCLQFYIREYGTWSYYLNGEENTSNVEKYGPILVDEYSKLMDIIRKLSMEDKEKWNGKVSSYVGNILNGIGYRDLPKDFALVLYEQHKDALELSIKTKVKYGFQLSEQEKQTQALLKLKEKKQEDKEDWEIELEINREYASAFSSSDNKLEFIKSIAEDSSMTKFERAKRIHACMWYTYERLYFGHPVADEYLSKYDWSVLGDILDIEEEILYDDLCECNSKEEIDKWFDMVNDNEVNHIINDAIVGDLENYCNRLSSYMDNIWEEIQKDIEKGYCNWFNIDFYGSWSTQHLAFLVKSMQSIRKVSFIMPQMIRHCERLEDFYRSQDDFFEEPLFNVFSSIKELAFDTHFEKDVPEQFALDYYDIESKYEDLMDEMSGKDYILNHKKIT